MQQKIQVFLSVHDFVFRHAGVVSIFLPDVSHLKELLVRGCSSKRYYDVNFISDDNITYVEKLK